jgi:hypothetical protein
MALGSRDVARASRHYANVGIVDLDQLKAERGRFVASAALSHATTSHRWEIHTGSSKYFMK